MTRPVLVTILSVVLFLAAAKAHGLELRLERELAGHWHVTFGSPNHPWVEALWRAERVRFWGMAVALAVGIVVADAFGALPWLRDPDGSRRWGRLAVAILLWAPSIAFFASGLWSAARVWASAASADGGGRLTGIARNEWLASALRTSAIWYGAVIVIAGAVVLAGSDRGLGQSCPTVATGR